MATRQTIGKPLAFPKLVEKHWAAVARGTRSTAWEVHIRDCGTKFYTVSSGVGLTTHCYVLDKPTIAGVVR